MKTAKDYSRAKILYFKPELKLCPNCNSTLHRSHIAWRKYIITLTGVFHVTSIAYKCRNTTCPKPQAIYRSTEAEMLSLKYYQFSLDVTAKVGHLYFRQHKTIDEITQTLKQHFKLQISRSEINLLYQAYLALIKADRRQDMAFLQKIRANGGITLAIDGVQPEKGNETLWILRDVPTGETLLAQNLSSADKDSIASLLREIKTFGIPVKGVISDGQRSIRLAVAQEFQDVAHQLCHFHFLRNIARPISEMDRALKVDLKKKVRGIKPIEKQAACQTDKKNQLILQYCKAIRFALQDEGCYPLEPGGLKLYRRLTVIEQSIERNNKLHRDSDLAKLQKVLGILNELKPRYRRISRLYKLIFEVNRILSQSATAEKIQSNMLSYFDTLAKLRFRRLEDKAAIFNILRFTASYWEGLFYHYDVLEIPRTNNDLEAYIGSLKVAHRKTTGRASCQGYIVRYGAYVALQDPFVSQADMLFRLRLVGYDAFRRYYVEIRSFRGRLSFKRALKRDLKGFLCGLELNWAKVAV